jgi:hypothetical protein
LITTLAEQLISVFRKLKRQFSSSSSTEKLTVRYCELSNKLDGILARHPKNPVFPQLEVFDDLGCSALPQLDSGSFEELHKNLTKLTSSDDQLQLLYLLSDLEPKLFSGANEVTVDLRRLKPETIVKLQSFVAGR